MLVRQEDLGRANGAIGLLTTLATAAAPAAAGILIDWQGINTLFIIDFCSFLVGILVISMTQIPMPEKSLDRELKEEADVEMLESKTSGVQAISDLKYALAYMKSKPGLLSIMSVGALLQFNIGAVSVLLLPVILGFATKTDYGLIQSSTLIGFVFGGALLMVWGGPKRKTTAALFFSCLVSLAFCFTPMFDSVRVFVFGAIIMAFAVSIAGTSTAVVWQKKVALDMQASVMGVRMSVARFMSLLGIVTSGYLADSYFEPGLMEGGRFAGSVLAQAYGLGQGRGAALLMSMMGVISLVILIMAWLNPKVRLIEDRLPDQLDTTE